jgi:hypothetical protein
MKLNNIILIASALLPLCTSNAMESPATIAKSYDNYQALMLEGFILIEEDFQRKFGYPIPTKSDDYNKTDFETFINRSTIFNPQKKSSNQITTTVNESLQSLKQENNEKINTKEKLCRDTVANNKQLHKIKQELEQTRKEKQKKIKDLERAMQKQRIIEAQKKERIIKAEQKKEINTRGTQCSEKSYLAQKRAITSKLIRTHNCQTAAQLKKIFHRICSDENVSCMGDFINSNAAYHYNKKTNELIVLIGEEIQHYTCCHECECY